MTTKINRTPFRMIKDISPALLARDDIQWDTPYSEGRKTTITSDGKRYSYMGSDGKQGLWWVTQGVEFRPFDRTWEEVEALVKPPVQKTEEPFRTGLPPARLRAVQVEWDWSDMTFTEHSITDFNSDGHHRFLTKDNKGTRKSAAELNTATWWHVASNDWFRPHGKTWAEVEALADAAEAGAKATLPQDGDPITVANALSVIKEGCKQAIAEDRQEAAQRNAARQQASTSSASGTTFTSSLTTVEIKYSAAPTRRMYIIAVPKGRRKYVKLYLKQHGYRNVDALPYNVATDASYDLGYVTKQLRDDLHAIAPDILLTY